MAKRGSREVVDVSVLLVSRGNRVLAAWNANWGCFSLPMTRRRRWPLPEKGNRSRLEHWEFAAGRAAAECLGTTCVLGRDLKRAFVLNDVRQSDRDGQVKSYRLEVFQLSFPARAAVATLPHLQVEWLPARDFVDANRVPISPTASVVLAKALELGVF